MTASAGYETFVRDIGDLREGEEHPLALRDLTAGRRKYFARHAIAVVTSTPGPGAQPLTVRSMVGQVVPGPHYVTIRRPLPSRIPGVPYENAFDALRDAWDQPPSDR